MFDGLAILAALYFHSKAKAEFKAIAFILLCWFIVSDVTYNYLFLDFRQANNWAIYLFYNIINLCVIYELVTNRAHLIATSLISSNVMLNIVASYYFISETVPHSVYSVYPYIAGAIALAVLAYMWVLTNGNRILERINHNRNRLDFLSRRSNRLGR